LEVIWIRSLDLPCQRSVLSKCYWSLYICQQLALKHSVFLLSVCMWSDNKSLWTQCLTNHFWEFHQIYTLDAVGDKDELIRFWGQKVEGQGHKYGHVSNLRGIFSHISRMHGLVLLKFVVTLPGPHNTDDILKVMGSKVKVTDSFSCRGIPIGGWLMCCRRRPYSFFAGILQRVWSGDDGNW